MAVQVLHGRFLHIVTVGAHYCFRVQLAPKVDKSESPLKYGHVEQHQLQGHCMRCHTTSLLAQMGYSRRRFRLANILCLVPSLEGIDHWGKHKDDYSFGRPGM